MDGGKGGMDIYMSKKESSGSWGPAINMELVNTAGNEVFPFVSSTGQLYFSSNGHDGMGGLDIYEARLNEGKATRIYNMGEPVNSRYDDFGIFLGDDNKTGFISSNRKAGGLDDDIYHLNILNEVRRGKDVLIVAKDRGTGLPAANVKLLVNSDTLFTNEKGELITMVDEAATLQIKTLKDDYFEMRDSVTTNSSQSEAFTKELLLEKNPKLFLRALITDAASNELMEGVTMKIIDKSSDQTLDVYTTTSGGDYFKFLFDKRLGDELNYEVRLQKSGYLPRNFYFKHLINKPGEINLNAMLDLKLGKVEAGMELTRMTDVQSIRFENGKTEIPSIGLSELDKVVHIMNEYPNISLQVCSHTDCRNSAISNMGLSSARAKIMADYIVKKGINRSRISARGYGESNLLNNCSCEGENKSNCPEEDHMKNNRTEFVITELK